MDTVTVDEQAGVISVEKDGLSVAFGDVLWAFFSTSGAWFVLWPARRLSWTLDLKWRLWSRDGRDTPAWWRRLGLRVGIRGHVLSLYPSYCYVADRNLLRVRYLWGGHGRT